MADGTIVDGSVSEAASIVAGTAELIAGTGIATGSDADAQLEIDVTMAATAITGNIHILDTAGGVTIGDSDPNPLLGMGTTSRASASRRSRGTTTSSCAPPARLRLPMP